MGRVYVSLPLTGPAARAGRDLRALEHVAPGAGRRTGERQAEVHAAHEGAIYTGAARAPIA